MNVEHSFSSTTNVRALRVSVFKRVRAKHLFYVFVALPTLLATIYFGFIASETYISESRFVIKSPDQKRAQISTLANLIQTTGLSGGQEQTNEILGYVRSRDALAGLVQKADIRAKYNLPGVDFMSRFPQPLSDGSFESLFRYYGKMVDARLDSQTGLAVVTVKAFTAKDAYAINEQILELSEQLVNKLNLRAQSKAISEAERQVVLATARLAAARARLAQYRNKQELIDPAKQAGGVLEIANTLIAQRAALQAQLDQMRRATPNNPSIHALENRVSAISVQIASQDNRVVGTDSAIASKLGGYESLVVEQEFATQNLNVASAALVQARAEAQRQQFYLERVVEPNVPDVPLLPRRLLSILVVAATALCLYMIGWMITVGILEHAPGD